MALKLTRILLRLDNVAGPASEVRAGAGHNCVLKQSGVIVCWGLNSDGQLGIGSTMTVGTSPSQMGDALAEVDLGSGAWIAKHSASSHLKGSGLMQD
jgi:alpha-tubulin suppressor-like RCC1 family protein